MSSIFQRPRWSANPRSEAPSLRGAAPGGAGVPATWTTGAKEGIGTAYYEPGTGDSASNVWFTLSAGALTEVYYPDVSMANLRVLQLAVTDGETFTDLEETDTDHEVELVYSDALVYRQTNTAKNGRYRIAKTYITHPDLHAVLLHVDFAALIGDVGAYRQYLYVNPVMSNGGSDIEAKILWHDDGSAVLLTENADTAMAVLASAPLIKASAGYAGAEDGLEELKRTFDVQSMYVYAKNGNVTQVAQVDPGAAAGAGQACAYTVAIGFGATADAALAAAEAALSTPFDQVLAAYRAGWQAFLGRLEPPAVGSLEQYNAAAMVLKAHEDKRHPGAIVASLTIPWGDRVVSTAGGIGGYHLVWSRDFYQVASTLLCIGDRSFAQRSLAYLDDIQQQADGSFPQNSWLDGRPYWRGLQMDQVAFPILLASQAGAAERYESMVRPAADFLIANGPATPQERWEENSGYSPSTLAAQIAALVEAARMARDAGDFGHAAVYLATADEWERRVEEWTSVAAGPLSAGPYYLRISDTSDPADGHWIEMRNGGGWHPKEEVVDAGFLELVRLGIKAADDPLITQSINVIDSVLRYDGPHGPVWRRYNHDGYGEQADGSGYHGLGIGRPWPLLVGERGEYEVAWQRSAQRSRPLHIYTPLRLLETMQGSANAGRLIPEQVWDEAPIPEQRLFPGQGTGSATPLAWAMAQYIRLCQCIAAGRIVEMPAEVEQRFLLNPPAIGPAVQVDSPLFGSMCRARTVSVVGRTHPGVTVVLRGQADQAGDGLTVATADGSGHFTATVVLWAAGENRLQLIGYDNDRAVSQTQWLLHYVPHTLLEVSDPAGDDNGPGSYVYPTHPDFHAGDFDLRSVRILNDPDYVYIDIGLCNLDDPWEGPSGLSKQLIDVYFHLPQDGGRLDTRGLGARFRDGAGWQRMVRISGNWHGETGVFDRADNRLGPVLIQPHYASRRVFARLSVVHLGGVPGPGWGVMVIVTGEENGGPRPIRSEAGAWDFGGGSTDNAHPLIVDLIVPDGEHQRDLLDWRRGEVRLPMVWL